MAGHEAYPGLEALRKLEASLEPHLPDPRSRLRRRRKLRRRTASAPPAWISLQRCLSFFSLPREPLYRLVRVPRVRKLALIGGVAGCVPLLVMALLWWRLSSGPIELAMATPWLRAAIAENLGEGRQVEIGGTQIEREGNWRISLRIRDIVVRDAEGTVVASAPKAEVGISALALFAARVRAERLSLVGAEMAVRIGADGRLTVFAGTNKRPFVTASAVSTSLLGSALASAGTAAPLAAAPPPVAAASRGAAADLAALLAWIESLDAAGLDGRDLSEVGLKGGNLTVDDQRNGKQWTFADIDLSITRPKGGGIALTLGSQAAEHPWRMRAAMTPGKAGHRIIDIDAQKVSVKDLMLAMRISDFLYEPDLPLSGRIRADIGPDGLPSMLDGRIVVEKGFIVDVDDASTRVAIDQAEIGLEWNAARQALVMPFQIVSGGNRITLLAQAQAPRESDGIWGVKVSGGTVVLAADAVADPDRLVLDRFLLSLRIDPGKQRIEVEPSEIGNADVGIALSGSIDYSSGDPRVMMGIAGTSMPVTAMKLLWPICAAPKVRSWVHEHVLSGTVERLLIATNAPWSTLKSSGPPVPDEGLSIEIVGHGAEIRPVAGLPAIRDGDLNVQISGRTATINLGRGNVELSPGRKLAITNGVFEVPDTFPKAPPAKARFRLDGSVQAAAELLALERLHDYASTPIDAATSRGTLTAQVTLALPLRPDLAPGSSIYTINIDVTNFVAERMIMSRKVEAALLKVSANNNGHWIRGDVKLNGIAAALDYRKPRDGDADVRVQAVLDERARSKLGFDLSDTVAGPIPIKLSGRVPAGEADGEARFSVEADLTQAKVDNLLPGWSKPAGEALRASFTLVDKPQATRLEDLVLEAPNASVKGAVEVDSSGDIVSANFPVFNLSSRNKASLRADRAADGSLRVILRGDFYDARGFVKSAMTGPAGRKQKSDPDVDLDIKLGTVLGFHGETLRGLELRLSRRGGVITGLSLSGKFGRDTPLMGDLRGRGYDGRQVVFLETNDAGAFFRFSDIYPKIAGGQMWVALDPQSADRAPQEGMLNVRDFAVRGEPALDRVAAAPAQPGGTSPGVEFSRLRVEFTRSLGRFIIREGLVRGPVIGATVEGYLDYHADEVRMRGTFVPLYGLNNMFGQIPIFGQLLGGSNEGLLGVTYEVVGPASAPILRVNPISAVAPGLLRKFFEFPSGNSLAAPQSYADPGRP